VRAVDAPLRYLVLKWAGASAAVSALQAVPCTNKPGQRTVYATKLADFQHNDERRCTIDADDDLFPLLNWPLLFPRGERLRLRNGSAFDGAEGIGVPRTALAVAHQPVRRETAANGRVVAGSPRAGGSRPPRAPLGNAARAPPGASSCSHGP
jgi:hypothetical protein